MRRDAATELMRDLLDKHKLSDWKIRLVTDLRNPFLGKCSYEHKCFYLNAHHIDTHHEELVKDTILHEIAHALCPKEGHNEVWRAKAKEIGSHSLEACAAYGLNLAAIDAIRSGDIVEVDYTEETIRKPKYNIHKVTDLCPECGKVAKEKFSFETVVNDETYKFTTLECFHIIKKHIPKSTPFHEFTTFSEDNCKVHEWDKTQCVKCGAYKLYPFQVAGALAIEKGLAIGRGFALFDEMGLGKTVMPLAYLKYHPEACPFLWVGKSGVKFQYFKEIVRWLGPSYLPQVIATGKDAVLPGLKGYIVSYDMLRRFDREKLASLGIKTIILDECQAIKNPDATRTQEVRDLVRNIDHVIPLSGTFWKNRGSEAFVALNMLDPKKFYSFEAFKNQWVDKYWEGNKMKEGGIRNPKKFREFISDIAIRRERKEVMPELPAVNRTKFYTQVPEHARNAYMAEVKNLVDIVNTATIGGEEDSFKTNAAVMQSLIRMRQIVGLAKIDATVELIDEHVENINGKLVVFVHHKACGEIITTKAKAIAANMNGDAPKVLQLTADLAGDERFRLQEEFNSSPRAILIASTLASGEGLNLQTCHDCIMHERQWNPANEEQAEGRFIRIGQESDSVNAIYVTAENSCDSQLDKIVERKRINFHNAMNKGEMPVWHEGSIIKELVMGIVEDYNKDRK